MQFKQWLNENFMKTDADPGDWVVVHQNIQAGAKGAIPLPAGNYLILAMDDETYTLKNTQSKATYQVFLDDFDAMVKDRSITILSDRE